MSKVNLVFVGVIRSSKMAIYLVVFNGFRFIKSSLYKLMLFCVNTLISRLTTKHYTMVQPQ